MPDCLAIRHVAFEHPGILSPVLDEHGFTTRIVDAGIDDIWAVDPLGADLLIMLGGPIGAYEVARYPFLGEEMWLLERRLAAGLPTLGICLGAQMMAQALGARVYPGPGKEIGWAALDLTDAGRNSPLRHLDGVAVLHWHGDTFDLPDGAVNLASTTLCAHQAFMHGPAMLGLQFHGEVDADEIERWLIGHANEIATVGLDPRTLRADSRTHGEPVKKAGAALFREWLSDLQTSGNWK
ncbi:glutamine amidotransferase [Niveispirillum irakense]|uniref:glutamine amidotransferase n=1 Tax=Niveispirillum irakense TaxID=34011 RepID=UPI000428330B|nr:glutamine amidotransferase [Niveispirillum irakense]